MILGFFLNLLSQLFSTKRLLGLETPRGRLDKFDEFKGFILKFQLQSGFVCEKWNQVFRSLWVKIFGPQIGQSQFLGSRPQILQFRVFHVKDHNHNILHDRCPFFQNIDRFWQSYNRLIIENCKSKSLKKCLFRADSANSCSEKSLLKY